MSSREIQLAELHSLVADLGKDGGLISPSIYDTAQVARLYPPKEGVEPALQWLLDQQQADGGWGEPEAPYARDVPTLAAVLALHTYPRYGNNRTAIDAGLAFLEQQAAQWTEMPIDALPIATEMILPYLIEEANRIGLQLAREPYAVLYKLRDRKCRAISAKPLQVGSPPTYSWEALGRQAHTIAPDRSGGIGHSPAATAAWLRQAEHQPDLADHCVTTRHYLEKAAAATGVGIPGVVPNVWPITGFELSYSLHALFVSNLFLQPLLGSTLELQIDRLANIMQKGGGISFGEYFTPDVDATGITTAILQTTAYPVNPAEILKFKHNDHFYTFYEELNPSILANAHALYGLAYTGERYPAAETFLLHHQCGDGRWLPDKCHHSWIYTTLEVILALSHLSYPTAIEHAVESLLAAQKDNGGWGSSTCATLVETSYVIVVLKLLERRSILNERARNALQQGQQWLVDYAHASKPSLERLWLGKELYRPYRVDRMYELGALLFASQEEILL